MLSASTHQDIIIGLDIHIVMVPSPAGPIPTPLPHPFIGFIFDPADLIPMLGATVSVNYKCRGCSFTTGMLGTMKHFPMPPGAAFTPKPIGHDAYKFFGSLRVKAEGSLLGVSPFMVMSCSDVGTPMSITPGKNFKPVPTTYLPTSACVPIPTGKPVMVGGPYVPDLQGLLMAIVMSFGMGSLMKGGGKLLKGAMNKAKAMGKRIKEKGIAWNKKLRAKNTKWSNKKADVLCKFGFEPVDLIAGIVFYTAEDFEMAGPFPLKWERSYYSDSTVVGACGHGMHSSYDIGLEAHPNEGYVMVTLPDGRPAIFEWLVEEKQSFYNVMEKMTLTRIIDGFELKDHDKNIAFSFEQFGKANFRPTRISNLQGFSIQYRYNREGKWTGLTDAVGKEIHFEFSDQGFISHVYATYKGSRKDLISYAYNEAGDMVQVKDALGRSTDIRYEDHLMVEKKDRNGDVFYWEYEGEGREAKCVHTWGDKGLMEGWINYGDGCNEVCNSLGETSLYYFDEDNLCTKIIDPLGNVKEFIYTEDMKLYREVDEEGLITGYTYDDQGNLTSLRKPDGATQHYLYDKAQKPQAVISESGKQTLYTYTANQLIKTMSYPDGRLAELSYNENKQLSRLQTGDGEVLKFFYDTDHNLIKMVLPGGGEQQWHYDPWGRCIAEINPEGQSKTYEFDSLDRVIQVKEPDGNKVTLDYDAYGEVIKVRDKQRKVDFVYNALGSMVRRVEAGKVISFHYDGQNRLTGLRNEHSELYRFVLDPMGRVVEEIGFDGLQRSYLRDRAGKVLRINRPGDRWTDYEYDLNGQVIRAEYSDGSWEAYGYDREGMLIEAVNENSQIVLIRDKAERVIQEMQDGHLVESGYNEKGFRTRISSSLGADIRLEWDATGSVKQMNARHGESGEDWEALLTHNQLGQECTRKIGALENEFTYDKAGRVAGQRTSRRGNTHLHKRYHWGINDKLQRIHDLMDHSWQDFEYDAVGNLVQSLTGVGSEDNYFRDEIGNIFQKADRSDRKYDKGGKLVAKGGTQYSYDEEGNLIQKSTPEGDWAFQWNGNCSLREVLRPDGRAVTFEYDALGRRTAKIFQSRLTRWVWDGNVPLHEWQYSLKDRPKSVLDADGLLTKDREEPVENLITWVFDEGSFKPAAKLAGEEAFSIINDYLGTPKEAFDREGQKVWDCKHKAYGEVASCFGDIDFIPFRFQGQYQDRETGLYYNRFRYYAPEEGMYVSQDPIGLAGSLKLYSYLEDPNYLIDPLGLKKCFADANARLYAEGIIKRNGGVKLKEGHYVFPNRRSARQAASEIAGDLGSNPATIRKKDYRGGPRGWESSNGKIGMQNNDKSSGWRDDSPGHNFGGGDKIPAHVNAWNSKKGVYDNLHLIY